MRFDPDALTRRGHAPTGGGRVLIVACGALAREIAALTRGMPHIDLACLPAILHNHPDRIVPELDRVVRRHRSACERIFVAYADCGTGGTLAAYCEANGLEMIPGPHCYSFFEGNARFAARDEIDAFYLTDFLARQFRAFVIEPLGLDRHPELRDTYFGHYKTLVYLAQTDDAELTRRAESAAQLLGLAFERRHTGYGDLATALASLTRADE